MVKFFRVIAIIFYVMAAILWAVIGSTTPGGLDRMGQPLDPELYHEVGGFMYWLIGTVTLLPALIVASIGAIFNRVSVRIDRRQKRKSWEHANVVAPK